MLRSYLAAAALALSFVAACSDDSTATNASVFGNFGGVSWVVPDSVGHLVVGWQSSTDATEYRVYISRIEGRELKTSPVIRTNPGTTSVVVTPDEMGEKYFVIVRAAKNGVEDGNTVEKSAVATPDKTAPQFAGATTATPSGNAGATVSWNAATDDLTPAEAIVYDVFAGATRASLAFVATSAPGATSIALNLLGDPTEPFFFEVRARDLAGNESPDTAVVSSPLGPDQTPPVFAGCDTATFADGKTATVTWKPATDNHSAQSDLAYAVFLATKPGGEDFASAPAAKVTNATTATLTGLTPGAQYDVVCRAIDVAGNSDLNTNEKSFTTPTDVTPPVFAGISSNYDAATNFDATKRIVSLSWAAATDDQTQQAQIVYDVFESEASGVYDFTAPVATSAPGALSIVVDDLPSNTPLYFIVRARDLANNRDANKVEVTGETFVSFQLDVQPIFNRNCAVVGCHVSGAQTGNLNLAPAFAYDSIVSVPAAESPTMKRVVPGSSGTSWLWTKISDATPPIGLTMPAPETGNTLTELDKAVIRSWIDVANAPNN